MEKYYFEMGKRKFNQMRLARTYFFYFVSFFTHFFPNANVKNQHFDGTVETFQIVATLNQTTLNTHTHSHTPLIFLVRVLENQDTEWNQPEQTRIHLRVNIALARHI